MANRRTVPPPLLGCKAEGAPIKFWSTQRKHRWDYSTSWNGNNRDALPFADNHTRGIARSGYRCYHCGTFAWDDDDISYALRLAYTWNLVSVPGPYCEAIKPAETTGG